MYKPVRGSTRAFITGPKRSSLLDSSLSCMIESTLRQLHDLIYPRAVIISDQARIVVVPIMESSIVRKVAHPSGDTAASSGSYHHRSVMRSLLPPKNKV
jgi:hypothetical protein